MVSPLLFQASNAGLGPRERRAQGLFQGLTALGAGLLAGGAPRVGAPAGAAAFAPGLQAFQNAMQVARRDAREARRDQLAEVTTGLKVREYQDRANAMAALRAQGQPPAPPPQQVMAPEGISDPIQPETRTAAGITNRLPATAWQRPNVQAAMATNDPGKVATALQQTPEAVEQRRRAQIAADPLVPVEGRGIFNRQTGEWIGTEQEQTATTERLVAEARVKRDVEALENMQNARDSLRGYATELGRARNILVEGGLETGRLAPAKAFFSRMLTALGASNEDLESLNLPDTTDYEEFLTIANKAVLRNLDSIKGALSNKELDFVTKTGISPENERETNLRIIDTVIKGAERSARQYDAALDWEDEYGRLGAKNEDGQRFDQWWRKEVDRLADEDEARRKEAEKRGRPVGNTGYRVIGVE